MIAEFPPRSRLRSVASLSQSDNKSGEYSVLKEARRTLWVISEIYYPEEVGTGYFMTGLAEGLSRDWEVRVICGYPIQQVPEVRSVSREVHNGVTIERCRGTRFNKDIVALRLVNLLTISFSIFFRTLLRVRHGDFVLVVTNPPALPFVVAIACWLRGARCILRLDDVYPEVMIASGISRPQSFVVRILTYLTRRLYCSVEQLVVLGRDMEQLARGKLGGASKRIATIPNWADADWVVPTSKSGNALLLELGLSEKFVVQCAGNMGRAQAIECMFQAAELLRDQQDIHFLFIGSGAKRKWMEQEVRDKRLMNVTLLDQRPRADQPNFLNACDVAIASLMPGMTGAGVPSRMYNILAAGKPIIAVADPLSELSLVVQEEQVGWIVPPSQPRLIAEAILKARSDRLALAEMGKRARAVAERKYPRARVIEAYRVMIQEMAALP